MVFRGPTDTWSRTVACERCKAPLTSSTMSMFNKEQICLTCKEEERDAPGYQHACAVELAEIHKRNDNFEGVGLSKVDSDYLTMRRATRQTRSVESA